MKRRRIATNRATPPTADNIAAYFERARLIGDAIHSLKSARDLLRRAGATNAHAATARAIKSTIGAHNHAIAMWDHLRNKQIAAFERHRRRDPHCTCNDCISHLDDSQRVALAVVLPPDDDEGGSNG